VTKLRGASDVQSLVRTNVSDWSAAKAKGIGWKEGTFAYVATSWIIKLVKVH
jgi:hypothetical protein